MENIFKALSDDNRLRIFQLLIHYNLCVCEIETILDLSQSNVSRHLGKLKSMNLIQGDKEAQWIHYQISDSFKENHTYLLKYLLDKFNQQPTFINDFRKAKAYVESPYTCQTIASDKELVISHMMQNLSNSNL